MTIHYKVWLEIEELDESRNHDQVVHTPGGAVASFAGYDGACRFVERANDLLEAIASVEVDDSPQPSPALELRLLHGRHDPRQEMEDWGFTAASIRGVAWMHFTYFSTMTVGFVSDEATEAARRQTNWPLWEDRVLQLLVVDDMIQAGGAYYGDFELCPVSS